MTRLEDALNDYSASGITPMHMPGHKRNPGYVPSYLLNDITEITGFDNLHAPSGILKDIEYDAAAVWNARSAVLSVNGATAPILSAVTAAASQGKILIAGNCHISVWHALEISGIDYTVIYPDTDPEFPFYLSVDPAKIEKALQDDPEIRTVVITSPTYEGVVSDTKSITEAAHRHDVSVIADEAHGAHFGLNDYFPETSAADVVIKSIHKTLHAPTQTAVLLIYSNRIREDLIRHYMDIFETSSPSYILMSGIDRVVQDLKENKDITCTWADALRTCRSRLKKELKHLSLFGQEGADPGKLVLLTAGVIDGTDLACMLRDKGIECEASYGTHLIAMTGIGDNEVTLGKFADAVISIDKTLEGSVVPADIPFPCTAPVIAMSVTEAVRAGNTEISRSECEGQISAEYIFRYPPGIPVLIPGQKITPDRIALIPKDTVKVIRG